MILILHVLILWTFTSAKYHENEIKLFNGYQIGVWLFLSLFQIMERMIPCMAISVVFQLLKMVNQIRPFPS